jgi:inosine/xanthosine triphosphatase
MKKVIVASKNPVKIDAVKRGFEKMLEGIEFEFLGVSVPSGVSDQPMTNVETLQGAKNRAQNAQKEVPEADYWVGVEGGCEETFEGMEAFAWVVVQSTDRMGKGKTGVFFLPEKIRVLVQSGIELGVADDMVFQRTNSKQANGAVGILTGDVLDRATFYIEAVIFALIPFKNSELY